MYCKPGLGTPIREINVLSTTSHECDFQVGENNLVVVEFFVPFGQTSLVISMRNFLCGHCHCSIL